MSDQEELMSFKCTQLFGYKGEEEKSIDEDLITSIKFDPTGKYLALGDKSGRIILFNAEDENN
jgi:hypothetical protein